MTAFRARSNASTETLITYAVSGLPSQTFYRTSFKYEKATLAVGLGSLNEVPTFTVGLRLLGRAIRAALEIPPPLSDKE